VRQAQAGKVKQRQSAPIACENPRLRGTISQGDVAQVLPRPSDRHQLF
jgi:hypothetical protein